MRLIEASGVSAGTVNTYYRVKTDRGVFYLRIDERGDVGAVEREVALLQYLEHLAVPHPFATRSHSFYSLFNDKPALLFSPIPGHPISTDHLTPIHLKQIGAWLAELHRVRITANFFEHRFHATYLLDTLYPRIAQEINTQHKDAALCLKEHLTEHMNQNISVDYRFDTLPQSIIHADMFEENLHFEQDTLIGVLDFEAAGRGPRLLDLAITLQALCFDVSTQKFKLAHAGALTHAYLDSTVITVDEIRAWPKLLTYSALRFLITRLHDFEISPIKTSQPLPKDYREYIGHLNALRDLYALVR